MQPNFVEVQGVATQDMEMLRGASLDAVLTFRNKITDPITGDVTYTLVNFTDQTAQLRVESLDGTLIFELTSAAGSLVLGGALGTITLNLVDTTALTPGEYLYQLNTTVTATGRVTPRLGPAKFTIKGGVI